MSHIDKSMHSRGHTPSHPRSRRLTAKNNRTLRACDRCRFKKSKCDGQQPCKSCITSDRTCIYSLRRRRDARNWYCGMQEAVEEAIQRLYNACKTSGCFPGVLPTEEFGRASTEEILTALGLFVSPLPNGETAAHLAKSGGRPELLEELDGSEANQDDSASESSDDTEAEDKHSPSLHVPAGMTRQLSSNTASSSHSSLPAKPHLQQQISSGSYDSDDSFFMHQQSVNSSTSYFSYDASLNAWPHNGNLSVSDVMPNDLYYHVTSTSAHLMSMNQHLPINRSQLSDFERRMMLVDD